MSRRRMLLEGKRLPIQLVDYTNGSTSQTDRGITVINNNNGSFTFSGTCSASVSFLYDGYRQQNIKANHKYLFLLEHIGLLGATYIYDSSIPAMFAPGVRVSTFFTARYNSVLCAIYTIWRPDEIAAVTLFPQLIDLTSTYGEGNEPTTVEQFKQDYPLDYYPYNPVG